jgi:hypothetical protein
VSAFEVVVTAVFDVVGAAAAPPCSPSS